MTPRGELYARWLETFCGAGIGVLSADTCARLLAILYVHGGEQEFFCFNEKCVTDVKYAQKRFNLCGGEIPTREGIVLIKKYVKDLEEIKEPKQWAKDFIQERYGEVLR